MLKITRACYSIKVHIHHVSVRNPLNLKCFSFSSSLCFPCKKQEKGMKREVSCQSAEELGQSGKLCFRNYYANKVSGLRSPLAESRSISYFSRDVRAPIKLSNAF